MGPRLAGIALLGLIAAALACDLATPPSPTGTPPRSPRRAAPRPTPDATDGAAQAATDGVPQPPGELVRAPLVERLRTPGAVRFVLDFPQPVFDIDQTTIPGILISTGEAIENVTSRGERRFRQVVGARHVILETAGTTVVWSPAFGELTALLPGGRRGWRRPYAGEVHARPDEVLLVDASTVAALGPDGQDRWRASPPGLRRLEGPYSCGRDEALFFGARGLEGVALRLTARGALAGEFPLERGARLIAAGPGCVALAHRSGDLVLYDPSGRITARWAAELPPLAFGTPTGIVLLVPQPDRRATRIVTLDPDGTRRGDDLLPLLGRLHHARPILDGRNERLAALAVCRDVTSPCAREADRRGPADTLVTFDRNGSSRVLVTAPSGGLDAVAHPAGGLVTAVSTSDGATTVGFRQDDETLLWETVLPGRLTAGPFVGRFGEIYLATCHGWTCRDPHLLFSLTAVLPPAVEDTDSVGATIE